MTIYDLQLNQPLEVDAKEAAELLKQDRFVTIPDKDYTITGGGLQSPYKVKSDTIKAYINNGYELTEEEGFTPEEGGSLARFTQGASDMFLGGVGLEVERKFSSPERQKQISQIEKEGGLAYRAGQAVGLAGDIVAGSKVLGVGKVIAKGYKLGDKIIKASQASKLKKAVSTGSVYGAYYGTLHGTAEAIKTEDPRKIAEHAVWSTVFGGALGGTFRGIGKAVEKGSEKISNFVARNTFEKATGINKKNLMSVGVKKEQMNTFLDNARKTVNEAIETGKLTAKSSVDDVYGVIKESLKKTGKKLSFGHKEIEQLDKIVKKSGKLEVLLLEPKKIASWGKAVETQLEVFAKLDNIYKIGLSRFKFFKETHKQLDDLSRVTIANLSKFSKGFNQEKYEKALISFDEALSKLNSKLGNSKNEIFIKSQIKDTRKIIDSYFKGGKFESKKSLNEILNSITGKEKKALIARLKEKPKNEVTEDLIKLIEKERTSGDFITMLRSKMKLYGENLQDLKNKFKGTPLEGRVNRANNINEFFAELKDFFVKYRTDVMFYRSKEYIRDLTRKSLAPNARQGFGLEGSAKRLYGSVERVLNNTQGNYLSYKQIVLLRDKLGKLTASAKGKSDAKVLSDADRTINKLYSEFVNLEERIRSKQVDFFADIGKKTLTDFSEFNAQKKLFHSLSKIRDSLKKSRMEGETADMGHIIAGQIIGSKTIGALGALAGASQFGVTGAVIGGVGGYAGSKFLPQVANTSMRQAFYHSSKYLQNLRTRMNDVEGYLTNPKKLDSLFHRTKDKFIGIKSQEIADFFGLSPKQTGISDIKKSINASLMNPDSASQVFRTESDILYSQGLGDVADLAFVKKLHIYSVLKEHIPQKTVDFVNRKPKYSKREEEDFRDILSIVSNPKNAFVKISNGSITNKEVEIFKNIYPNLYMRMALRFSEYLERGKTLNRKQEEAIKRFLGIKKPDLSMLLQKPPMQDNLKVAKPVTNLKDTSERSIDRVQQI